MKAGLFQHQCPSANKFEVAMSIISSPLPIRPYRRIATEEAFSPPAMLDIYKRILKQGGVDPDLGVQRDE